MTFTKETLDFNGKTDAEIIKTLDEYNIPLAPEEIKKIQNDFLARAPSVVMSHESHNHPSQIVPYEGAATGVGGNVRDVCCMGAEVIATTDSLRFGDIQSNKTKWIHDGVVDGIGGYGNPLGIPNIGGDIYYHSD